MMGRILLLYFEKTRSRVDGKLPVPYQVSNATAWCRNSSLAAVSNLLELKSELKMDHGRVRHLA